MTDTDDSSVRIVGFCTICQHPLTLCDCIACVYGEGPGLAHATLPEGFETQSHLAEGDFMRLTMRLFLSALESNTVGAAEELIARGCHPAAIEAKTIKAVNKGWAKFVGGTDRPVITEEGKEALAHLRSNQVPS